MSTCHRVFALILLGSLLLTGCGPAAPTPTPVATAVLVAAATSPTAAPVPPTATPAPTRTPAPPATPRPTPLAPLDGRGGGVIAFSSNRDNANDVEIYVMNADGTDPRRLTNTAAGNMDPDWSPDGKQIAFIAGAPGRFILYVMDAGGGNVTELPIGDGDGWCSLWSPDGTQIAFYSYRPSPYRDGKPNAIYVVSADGSNLRQLAKLATSSWRPVWRP